MLRIRYIGYDWGSPSEVNPGRRTSGYFARFTSKTVASVGSINPSGLLKRKEQIFNNFAKKFYMSVVFWTSSSKSIKNKLL